MKEAQVTQRKSQSYCYLVNELEKMKNFVLAQKGKSKQNANFNKLTFV